MKISIKSTKKTEHHSGSFLITGRSGAGKSTILGTLPCKPEEVCVIDIENGLEVLRGQDIQTIPFWEMEGDPIAKMRECIKFLRESEFKWVGMDSFTMLAEQIKAHMEHNAAQYGLLTKSGAFDGLKLYGELKKTYGGIINAFLALPDKSKVVICGAEEKADGPDSRIETLIPGSYSDTIMFNFDEAYGMRVTKTDDGLKRQFVTNSDGAWVAKSRMSGGSDNALETYENASIKEVIAKCYS